jgi:hypothetical protein
MRRHLQAKNSPTLTKLYRPGKFDLDVIMLQLQASLYILLHICDKQQHNLYNVACLYVFHILLHKHCKLLHIFCIVPRGLHWLCWQQLTRRRHQHKPNKVLRNVPFLIYLCFLMNKFHRRLHNFRKHQYNFEFSYFPF